MHGVVGIRWAHSDPLGHEQEEDPGVLEAALSHGLGAPGGHQVGGEVALHAPELADLAKAEACEQVGVFGEDGHVRKHAPLGVHSLHVEGDLHQVLVCGAHHHRRALPVLLHALLQALDYQRQGHPAGPGVVLQAAAFPGQEGRLAARPRGLLALAAAVAAAGRHASAHVVLGRLLLLVLVAAQIGIRLLLLAVPYHGLVLHAPLL
mmetsp:Transcript_101767/g.270747  ORF Transcript_101767/g.270747 Transcript_101767/m.270747 type:complete len:206 (+) Transcript_101767:343-960(+)